MQPRLGDAEGEKGRTICPRCGYVFSVKILPKKLFKSFGSLVCPRCKSVTPDAKYCMWCGNSLEAQLDAGPRHLVKIETSATEGSGGLRGELVSTYHYTFDVLVLGEAAVGKTTLLKRYAEGSFIVEYTPTFGIIQLERKVSLDDVYVTLKLWDVASEYVDSDEFRSVTKKAEAVILMFDTTRRGSLATADKYLRLLQKLGKSPRLLYIVANKRDLGRAGVSRGDIERMAHQAARYFEVSAKTGENVDELFTSLIRDLLRLRLEGLKAEGVK